jgi:hypothetical protein
MSAESATEQPEDNNDGGFEDEHADVGATHQMA